MTTFTILRTQRGKKYPSPLPSPLHTFMPLPVQACFSACLSPPASLPLQGFRLHSLYSYWPSKSHWNTVIDRQPGSLSPPFWPILLPSNVPQPLTSLKSFKRTIHPCSPNSFYIPPFCPTILPNWQSKLTEPLPSPRTLLHRHCYYPSASYGPHPKSCLSDFTDLACLPSYPSYLL